MNNIQHFSLPISGLKNGNHVYNFELDESFFKEFENNLIEKGHFEAKVEVDKRSNLMILLSDIKGYMETNCDRCMADIKLPLTAKNTILVKTGDPAESDDEVMYIHEDEIALNVAPLLYENIVVAIPLIKVYACEKEKLRPCNMEILKILNQSDDFDGDQDDSENLFIDIKL